MGQKPSAEAQPQQAATTETESDKKHPDNKKLSGDEWTDLKDKKRGCTDCLCLLLLIVAWIIMTIVGFIVCGVVSDSRLKTGNPYRLTNAVDYSGMICGYNKEVKHKKMAYYMASGAVVCVSSCPSEIDYKAFICYYDYQAAADASPLKAWTYVGEKTCMFHAKTYKVLNRCVYDPDQSSSSSNSTAATTAALYGVASSLIPSKYSSSFSSATSASDWFESFMGDLWSLKGYIFGFGLGISVFFSFIYLYFLRIPGLLSCIIWTIIFSIQITLVVGSILLYQLAVTWRSGGVKTDNEVKFMFAVSYIGFAISFLYFCLMLILMKRIALAISIVKEAARAIGTMPLLIFTPIIEAIGVVMFLIPWTIYVVYLASSGDIETTTTNGITYKTFSYDKNTKYAFLYMLFCWFWTSQFIIAFGQIIVALAISSWYFCKEKSTIGSGTVIWAFKTASLYHVGTAAHGSLIIAIIKTIRAIVMYFQKKAKDSKNCLMQWVLCCVQCCLCCLEKCMKFINKNAYIQTAIYGYSFCKAARAAFFLILRNILRIAAVNMVGDFVLLMGKLFVTVFTTFICYLVLAYALSSHETTGIVGPLILVALLSFFIACMFTEIFGMAIETILCCYIADEEMFPPEKRYADGPLRSAIQKTASSVQVTPAGNTANNNDTGKNGPLV